MLSLNSEHHEQHGGAVHRLIDEGNEDRLKFSLKKKQQQLNSVLKAHSAVSISTRRPNLLYLWVFSLHVYTPLRHPDCQPSIP